MALFAHADYEGRQLFIFAADYVACCCLLAACPSYVLCGLGVTIRCRTQLSVMNAKYSHLAAYRRHSIISISDINPRLSRFCKSFKISKPNKILQKKPSNPHEKTI